MHLQHTHNLATLTAGKTSSGILSQPLTHCASYYYSDTYTPTTLSHCVCVAVQTCFTFQPLAHNTRHSHTRLSLQLVLLVYTTAFLAYPPAHNTHTHTLTLPLAPSCQQLAINALTAVSLHTGSRFANNSSCAIAKQEHSHCSSSGNTRQRFATQAGQGQTSTTSSITGSTGHALRRQLNASLVACSSLSDPPCTLAGASGISLFTFAPSTKYYTLCQGSTSLSVLPPSSPCQVRPATTHTLSYTPTHTHTTQRTHTHPTKQ